MSNNASELRYAVRFRVLFRHLGQLFLVLAALTVPPLIASLVFGEYDISLRLAIVLAAFGLIGAPLSRIPKSTRVQINEGMALVALVFLLAAAAMTFPMSASGLTAMDAFFEATSGVTTTGLTLVRFDDLPRTILFLRSWLQWFGGLGIVVLSLAVIVEPGLIAKGVGVQEGDHEDLIGGMRAWARSMMRVYLLLTGAGILGLLLLGTGPFNALVYTFSSVSTGGFASSPESLGGLGGWPVQTCVFILFLLGAMPFLLLHRILRRAGNVKIELLQARLLILAGLCTTALLCACFIFVDGMSPAQAIRAAPLNAFSAQTTTGFSTLNIAKLDAASKLVLIFAMLSGGASGSSAGGIKILRVLIGLQLVHLMLRRTGLVPHALLPPRLGGRLLQESDLRDALMVVFMFLAVIGLSWLAFVAHGYGALDSLFEVTSATGTVGLSTGLCSPQLPGFLKGVLCADMLLGRLEIFAWLVLIYPRTWIGRRREMP